MTPLRRAFVAGLPLALVLLAHAAGWIPLRGFGAPRSLPALLGVLAAPALGVVLLAVDVRITGLLRRRHLRLRPPPRPASAGASLRKVDVRGPRTRDLATARGAVAAAYVALAAASEEALRVAGLLLLLGAGWHVALAVLAVALVDAALHAGHGWWAVPAKALNAAVLSSAFLVTGLWWVPWIAHVTFNTLVWTRIRDPSPVGRSRSAPTPP